MVLGDQTKNQVTGMKLSSVVPAKPSEEEKTHELKTIDLAMKLHYIKAIYFFDKEAVEGFTIYDLKAPMFPLLNMFRQVAGRIRCTENNEQRPFIKCNDGGVRIVEAKCNDTVHEFLNDVRGEDDHDHHCTVYDRLVYDPVVGPDLGFSPLAFIQFTWFKCGGISIGLSWSHILGDAFSASNFINMWAKFMSGHVSPETFNVHDANDKVERLSPFSDTPLSVKIVDSVGDRWITANEGQMATHSFHVTANQLNHFMSGVNDQNDDNVAKVSPFEILAAMVWKSINRIRGDSGPKTVTVCRKNHGGNNILANSQVIAMVEADSSVTKTELPELASSLVANKATDEKTAIQKTREKNEGKRDCVLYGANLTFVNLEDACLYEMEIKKQKPAFVNYMIHGVGDEGVVLVLPRKSKDNADQEHTITVTLPETQLSALKNELKIEWNIV